MPSISICSAASLDSRSGAKPPSSPTARAEPAVVQRLLERVEDLGAHAQRLGERRRADRHDHELLEVDRVVGVRAAVEDVHHRHGQHVRRLAAEVAPQRQALLRRGGRARRRARRRGSRWRPAAPCSACRRGRSARGRGPAWSSASKPATASAISPLTLPTAFVTPLPPQASPPSRSSVASNSPVEAPDGTAARPVRAGAQARRRPRRSGCRGSRGSGGRGRVSIWLTGQVSSFRRARA